MEKITKDMCISETNNDWRSKFRWGIAIVILGAFTIDVESNGIWWLMAYVIFFGDIYVNLILFVAQEI